MPSLLNWEQECKARAKQLGEERTWSGAFLEADALERAGYDFSDLDKSFLAQTIKRYVLDNAPPGSFLGVRDGIARFKDPGETCTLYFPEP
jgi:hypothetical protein